MSRVGVVTKILGMFFGFGRTLQRRLRFLADGKKAWGGLRLFLSMRSVHCENDQMELSSQNQRPLVAP